LRHSANVIELTKFDKTAIQGFAGSIGHWALEPVYKNIQPEPGFSETNEKAITSTRPNHPVTPGHIAIRTEFYWKVSCTQFLEQTDKSLTSLRSSLNENILPT
jgi:hypothetical protein